MCNYQRNVVHQTLKNAGFPLSVMQSNYFYITSGILEQASLSQFEDAQKTEPF